MIRYLRDCINELHLVTWPKQERLLDMTTLTLVTVLISASALGLVDYGFSHLFQWLLTLKS